MHYNRKVQHILSSNSENMNKLKKVNTKIDSQNQQICELELLSDLLSKEIENDQIIYKEKEVLNKLKIEELEKKVTDLQKKVKKLNFSRFTNIK